MLEFLQRLLGNTNAEATPSRSPEDSQDGDIATPPKPRAPAFYVTSSNIPGDV